MKNIDTVVLDIIHKNKRKYELMTVRPHHCPQNKIYLPHTTKTDKTRESKINTRPANRSDRSYKPFHEMMQHPAVVGAAVVGAAARPPLGLFKLPSHNLVTTSLHVRPSHSSPHDRSVHGFPALPR